MRKDQRNGLRVLAVDEFGELGRIGFTQCVEAERFVAHRLHQAIQHFFGLLRSECIDQNLARVVDASLDHVVVRHRHLVELFKHTFDFLGVEGLYARDFAAELLDFFLVEAAKDNAGGLFPYRHQQDGGLTQT